MAYAGSLTGRKWPRYGLIWRVFRRDAPVPTAHHRCGTVKLLGNYMDHRDSSTNSSPPTHQSQCGRPATALIRGSRGSRFCCRFSSTWWSAASSRGSHSAPAAPPSGPMHRRDAGRVKPTTGSGLSYQHYPIVYTVKIALTIAAILFVLPGYRQFPFRISPLAIVVGVVGVVLMDLAVPTAPRTKAVDGDWPRKTGRNLGAAAGVQSARSNWPPRQPGPTPFWRSASSASRSSCRSSKSSSCAVS